MNIRPNFAYTAKEVQEDVQRVFAGGYFSKLTPIAEDTRDGVKLTMQVGILRYASFELLARTKRLCDKLILNSLNSVSRPLEYQAQVYSFDKAHTTYCLARHHSISLTGFVVGGLLWQLDCHQVDAEYCTNVQVEPNPELRGIVASGANVLPQRVIQDAFCLQHGRTLNFPAFGDAINRINDWYKERGLLGQVQHPHVANLVVQILPLHLTGSHHTYCAG